MLHLRIAHDEWLIAPAGGCFDLDVVNDVLPEELLSHRFAIPDEPSSKFRADRWVANGEVGVVPFGAFKGFEAKVSS